jgi:hypothetical protein
MSVVDSEHTQNTRPTTFESLIEEIETAASHNNYFGLDKSQRKFQITTNLSQIYAKEEQIVQALQSDEQYAVMTSKLIHLAEYIPNKEAVPYVTRILQSQINTIKNKITSDNEDDRRYSFQAVNFLVKQNMPEIEEIVDYIVRDNTKILSTELNRPEGSSSEVLEFIATVLNTTTEENAKKIVEVLNNLLRNPNQSSEEITVILSTLLHQTSPPRVQEYGSNLLKSLVESCGLNYEDMRRAWLKGAVNIDAAVVLNIEIMRDLSLENPDYLPYLRNECGIRNFGRYTPEMLKNQYEYRNDTETEYIIAINPVHDKEGPMSTGVFFDHREIYNHLFTELQSLPEGQKAILRIYEADDKFEFLQHLKNAYQRHKKFQNALIGGHGTTDSVSFGGKDIVHKIVTSDFDTPEFQEIKNFFEDLPTVVLVSCSTGSEGGIGQKISEVLQCILLAPETPAALEAIHVAFNQETQKLELTVTYRNSVQVKYSNGVRVTE